MIESFAFLLGFQLAGTISVVALGLPIPGPVAGLALVAIWLAVKFPVPQSLQSTANALVAHLSLLFVPAATGVIQHAERISTEGWILFLAILVSTVLALLVSAITFVSVAKLTKEEATGEELKS